MRANVCSKTGLSTLRIMRGLRPCFRASCKTTSKWSGMPLSLRWTSWHHQSRIPSVEPIGLGVIFLFKYLCCWVNYLIVEQNGGAEFQGREMSKPVLVLAFDMLNWWECEGCGPQKGWIFSSYYKLEWLSQRIWILNGYVVLVFTKTCWYALYRYYFSLISGTFYLNI